MHPFLIVATTILSASPPRSTIPLADCRQLPATSAAAATPNDNRVRAGNLRNGVLTVRLVARSAAWRPEGAGGCALGVNAFAEEGRPTQVPGPLLRVMKGTEVRATVRNALPTTIWMRGFQDRVLGALDSVAIAPGATHAFRFTAVTPGAWIYWAGAEATQQIAGDANGQLAGAMIVDSTAPGNGAQPDDRVLVLTRWKVDGKGNNEGFQVNAFNGLSWPHSERLHYTAGDSVRWHVLNATNTTHEMHLHGFFFRMDRRGYSVDSSGIRPFPGRGEMKVTSVLRPGEWLSLVWSAERPGNWLFHCHITSHMNGEQRLAVMSASHGVEENQATHDMAGLVLGVEVSPRPGATAAAASTAPVRSIDLFANTRPRVFGENAGYGFVMQEGSQAPTPDSIRIPGSPLILTRGEPVRIAVHNRLATPISVHWHGIELDSYMDGVGGFSGAGAHIAPMIAPDSIFIVRFTPPRAGTYMYHVHGERGEELASGLYGPLIVSDPGTPYNPDTDRYFIVANGGPGPHPAPFINGSATPDTMDMVAGRTYRLRFMYIMSNDVFITTLRGPTGPMTIRRVAADGHDVPTIATIPMRLPSGPGHTLDVEFTPAEPGELALEVSYAPVTGVTNVPPSRVPIRVRRP